MDKQSDFPRQGKDESDDDFRRRARKWFDANDGGSEGEWLYLCSLWGIEATA